MRPMDAAATATAMALAAQRSAVQATQTAIAGGATRIQTASSDLYVIVKWVPIVLRAEPGVSAPAIATVSPPNTLRVLDTSKNPWFLAESPTGEQGWLNGRLFVYGGNASLLPEDLRIRVITDRSDLPFVEGRIVSHDGVQKEYRPYVLPDEGSQEMNISVPIEWEVLVLLEDYGSRRFGSGKWYLVAFPDPGGRDVIYYGYLPVEVITER